jgi:hypothetical protein
MWECEFDSAPIQITLNSFREHPPDSRRTASGLLPRQRREPARTGPRRYVAAGVARAGDRLPKPYDNSSQSYKNVITGHLSVMIILRERMGICHIEVRHRLLLRFSKWHKTRSVKDCANGTLFKIVVREGDILLHLAIARFIISETPDDRIELCDKCADLPRFKNAVRHWIPDKT